MSLIGPPPGCTPRFGDCRCSCHTSPHVYHCMPCCSPRDVEAQQQREPMIMFDEAAEVPPHVWDLGLERSFTEVFKRSPRRKS